MKRNLSILFLIVASIAFAQNKRTYIEGTSHQLYGQKLELKNKLSEDKVFFTLEMQMDQNIDQQQIETMQASMQKDVSNSFIVKDPASNKITFFTCKSALRHVDMIDYCKRILILSGGKTGYSGYSENILEFVLEN